jgi:hypothetical protein
MIRARSRPAGGRARSPLHINWRLVVVIYGLYTLLTLLSGGSAGRFGNGWLLANAFLNPLTHVAAFTLFAPLPWMLWRRTGSWLELLRGFLLALVGCEAVAYAILVLDWWMERMGGRPFNLPMLTRVYAIFVGPIMIVLGGLMAARARAVGENEAIREEAMIAKSRLLQSQLHPHVLFNALNGLAELIHKDPPTAERSVGHLADLLRRTLRASERPLFPLGEERALVEDYLFLEGLRLGPRLVVRWDWDSGLDGTLVPPLLIQPLVENAIKHGISPCREGGDLVIGARHRGPDLVLEVWNTGAPFLERLEGGIGLRNLEARLGLVYGPSARFAIGPDGDGIRAVIHLPRALLHYGDEAIAGTGS